MKYLLKKNMELRVKRSCKHLIYILLLFISNNINSLAQDISHVKHSEVKDGLADRKVDFITRSENGEFYIVTGKSIQEFNGSDFQEMDSIPHDFYSSKIKFINNNRFHNPTLIMQNQRPLSAFVRENQLNYISDISFKTESDTSSDSVFVCGNEHQLFHLKKTNDKRYLVLENEVEIGSLSLDKIPQKLFFDSESNTFFTSDLDKSIKAINKDFEKTFRGKILWKNNTIIYCNTEGLFEWKDNNFVEKVKLNAESNDILWAKADNLGNILIALHINIAKINKLFLWTNEEELISYDNILKINNNIIDVYAEDFEDKFLLGTFNGLYSIKLANKGIKKYWHTPNLPKSSFGAVVTGVVNNYNSSYFIKEAGGLYELKNDEYFPLLSDSQLKNNNGLLYYKNNNELLITSYNFNDSGILTIYDIGRKKVKKKIPLDFIPLQMNFLNEHQIVISGRSNNNLLNKKANKGRSIIYDLREHIHKELFLPDSLKNKEIRSVIFDKLHEKYWIGTNEGLFLLQAEKVKKLLDSHIRISKIINEKIWIGSKGDGLFIYDRKTEILVKRLTSNYELTDNSIISIEVDQNENIWLGSFNGVIVFNKSMELIKRIYEDEGLSNPEFNTNASCINEEGEILMGTINGLTKISPDIINKKEVVTIDITDIEIWHKSKTQRSNYHRDFKLKKPFDSLIVHYKTPDYYPSNHSLKSSDFKINNSPNLEIKLRENQFQLTNFNVGKNTIDLFANNDSFRFKGENKIQFDVKPNLRPFYIALLSILLIGLVYLIFRVQQKNSEATLTEEKVKFNKQLAEMELTALRSQMNPHFIFNALGAIQYFINTKDIEKADEYLSKFAKLMRFILESSKSKFIKLEDEINMLQLYISLEHIRFEQKFTYEFKISEEINDIEFNIPSMIIQPIVENAINHGLYHLENRTGKLDVIFEYKNESEIQCKIIDNGIGRKAALNFRKEKEHTSRGMQIIKERINALKTSDLYDLDIEYTDLYEPTTGTEVLIKIYQKN